MFCFTLHVGRWTSRLKIVNNLMCLNIKVRYNFGIRVLCFVHLHCVALCSWCLWVLLWFSLAPWFSWGMLHKKTIKEMGFLSMSRYFSQFLTQYPMSLSWSLENIHTIMRKKNGRNPYLSNIKLVFFTSFQNSTLYDFKALKPYRFGKAYSTTLTFEVKYARWAWENKYFFDIILGVLWLNIVDTWIACKHVEVYMLRWQPIQNQR